MPKEARLIAAVLAVVVVIVGALVLFSGDDDSEVEASDTTASTSSSAASSTSAAPVSTGASQTTVTEETTQDTPAPSTEPDDGASGDTPAGSVGVKEVATWQTNIAPDEVRARFDAAESSEDKCVRLAALTSLPDLNVLPTLSQDDVDEYFTRWQELAKRTEADVDGEMQIRFTGAEDAMASVQKIVEANGGTFNQNAVDELIDDDGSELTQLLGFFALVAAQCPAPAA